jgi:sugar lactone lactonase YvrE
VTGCVFEFTPEGRFVRSFGEEGNLNWPRALAFAPPAAERHGFRPGHLFVTGEGPFLNPLNPDSLREFTPDGQYVRTFTGGAYLSTRAVGLHSLAFTPDGRLLVNSSATTDAVLEFTAGGNTVRRFANLVPYGGVTVDRRGHVYVAGGWQYSSPVHVFSPQGELLRTVGEAESNVYLGLAVDERGRLYVANCPAHLIDIYDPEGRPLGSLAGGGLHHPLWIALRPSGDLYVLNEDGQSIRAFDPASRAFLFSFPAPPGVQWTNLTFGPNGNLFVTGVQK